MSKVTVRQLCELFKQITEKRVNEEAIQEIIEKAKQVALPQHLKKVLQQALKTVAEINVAYLQT